MPASMRKEWEALKTAGSQKNQSKFIEDILDDEVQVKTQDGVAFCQWRQLKEERVDPKKVSGQQAAQMAMLFESVSMERPDPSAEDLSAASSSVPSTFPSPQQGAPTLPAIEDKKEDEEDDARKMMLRLWSGSAPKSGSRQMAC